MLIFRMVQHEVSDVPSTSLNFTLSSFKKESEEAPDVTGILLIVIFLSHVFIYQRENTFKVDI